METVRAIAEASPVVVAYAGLAIFLAIALMARREDVVRYKPRSRTTAPKKR